MPPTYDDVVAEAVFKQLVASARMLHMFELMQLRSVYNGTTSYAQLSDSLRRKMRDIGLAAIAASGTAPYQK